MSFLSCTKAFRINGPFTRLPSGRSHLRLAVPRSLEIKLIASVLLIVICSLAAACAVRSSPTSPSTTSNTVHAETVVDINTATLDELQSIPHVGEKIAARIIEHREVNGPFRRVEHLMLIQGISDRRFRKIRALVKAE